MELCLHCGAHRWISVKERTPRNSVEVQVRAEGELYSYARFHEPYPDQCGEWFILGSPPYPFEPHEITHWRPIDPPEDCRV